LPVLVKPRVSRGSTPAADSTPVIEVKLRRGMLRVHGGDLVLLRALVDALSAQ
jgi:hypothetical protein